MVPDEYGDCLDNLGGQADDDDNDAGLDDDDAGSGCGEGCSVTGEVSSEEAAPFVAGGILGGGILWARRKRGRTAA